MDSEMFNSLERAKAATSKQLLELLEKQEFLCALTGRPLTPDVASIDHVVAHSRGGQSDIRNLMWLHRQANSAKGTMSRDEFVELCREVIAFTDAVERGMDSKVA